MAASEHNLAPNNAHPHAAVRPTNTRVPIRQLQSGPDSRQDVQRHDYLPVWKKLPTMSRQEIQRMMLQNVGLAGHIVSFGAIWQAVANHGGYANVSPARFSSFAFIRSSLIVFATNDRSAINGYGSQ